MKGQSLRVLSFWVEGRRVVMEIRELSISEVEEALLLIKEALLLIMKYFLIRNRRSALLKESVSFLIR